MVQNPKYKSAECIIHQLCDIVSKNGNLLLNVGPYADGSFHPDAVKTLEEIGDWLALNGEAIYETRPYLIAAEGPTVVEDADYDTQRIAEQLDKGAAADVRSNVLTGRDYRFTTRGEILYVIAMGWPEEGWFRIRTLRENGPCAKKVGRVTLIGQKEPLTFIRDGEALHVKAPERKPCDYAYVLKIEE